MITDKKEGTILRQYKFLTTKLETCSAKAQKYEILIAEKDEQLRDYEYLKSVSEDRMTTLLALKKELEQSNALVKRNNLRSLAEELQSTQAKLQTAEDMLAMSQADLESEKQSKTCDTCQWLEGYEPLEKSQFKLDFQLLQARHQKEKEDFHRASKSNGTFEGGEF